MCIRDRIAQRIVSHYSTVLIEDLNLDHDAGDRVPLLHTSAVQVLAICAVSHEDWQRPLLDFFLPGKRNASMIESYISSEWHALPFVKQHLHKVLNEHSVGHFPGFAFPESGGRRLELRLTEGRERESN